ncbi:serine/threonine-protein kinase HipA [Burkholderia multivorans]
MDILARSTEAARDRLTFLTAQIVFWALAATDGHAKNFSLAHLPRNACRATPLYDVLSVYPVPGNGRSQLAPQKAKLAMAVRGKNRHDALREIFPKHWTALGLCTGLTEDDVSAAIAAVADETERVIGEVSAAIPANFPMDVADAIFT